MRFFQAIYLKTIPCLDVQTVVGMFYDAKYSVYCEDRTWLSASVNYRVEGESTNYRIWVGGYSGNASDSLSAHNGYQFSTMDKNNDQAPKCCPCAPAYGGGWWFYRYQAILR